MWRFTRQEAAPLLTWPQQGEARRLCAVPVCPSVHPSRLGWGGASLSSGRPELGTDMLSRTCSLLPLGSWPGVGSCPDLVLCSCLGTVKCGVRVLCTLPRGGPGVAPGWAPGEGPPCASVGFPPSIRSVIRSFGPGFVQWPTGYSALAVFPGTGSIKGRETPPPRLSGHRGWGGGCRGVWVSHVDPPRMPLREAVLS